jgi:hypothetical protein
LEDAGLDPLLEAIMSGGPGTETGGIQGFPLAAGAEDEQDGVHTETVRRAGSSAAEAMRVGMLGEQGGDGFPEVIGDAPVVQGLGKSHDFASNAYQL